MDKWPVDKWPLRVALILFHVFQYLVTASAGLSLASIIAALMVGAQILPREHFLKTFKVQPLRVSQYGSLVWMAVAFLEMSLRGGG